MCPTLCNALLAYEHVSHIKYPRRTPGRKLAPFISSISWIAAKDIINDSRAKLKRDSETAKTHIDMNMWRDYKRITFKRRAYNTGKPWDEFTEKKKYLFKSSESTILYIVSCISLTFFFYLFLILVHIWYIFVKQRPAICVVVFETVTVNIYSILFYSILFYSILFYSILKRDRTTVED